MSLAGHVTLETSPYDEQLYDEVQDATDGDADDIADSVDVEGRFMDDDWVFEDRFMEDDWIVDESNDVDVDREGSVELALVFPWLHTDIPDIVLA